MVHTYSSPKMDELKDKWTVRILSSEGPTQFLEVYGTGAADARIT